MKKEKVLFDTSCVYAVLSHNLEPTLASQFPPQTKKCIYYTSQYLRMEFLRRWIITGIEIYLDACVRKDINETLQNFSHHFSQRENKIVIQWANRYIESIISAGPPTEPIDWFGWEVLSLALNYDEIFHHLVQPKTGCKRGEVVMDFDNPTRREVLWDFHERFTDREHKCKLEAILDIKNKCPHLRKMRKASRKDFPDLSVQHLLGFRKLQSEMEKIINSGQAPKCDECYKIGDIIIALEKPPKTTLYHVDYSFSAICPLLKTEHKQLDSVLKD